MASCMPSVAQHDLNIDASVTPAQLRAELNQSLAALASNNSGTSEPTPTFPFQLWADLLEGEMKQRNAANTDWIVLGDLDQEGWNIPLKRRILFRTGISFSGNDVATPQSIFGVGATLSANMAYEIEIIAHLQKTSGTTMHGISFLLGGTASYSSIGLRLSVDYGANATLLPAFVTAASATPFISGINAANAGVTIQASGILVTSSSGSIVPQYQCSSAPGGAYTTQVGSLISLYPLKQVSPGTNLALGEWS